MGKGNGGKGKAKKEVNTDTLTDLSSLYKPPEPNP